MKTRAIAVVALMSLVVTLAAGLASAQEEGPILLPKFKPIPRPASPTLLVLCDLACNWKLDGEPKGRIDAGRSAKVNVELGQHLVVATTEDGVDQVKQFVKAEDKGQSVVSIELLPVRDARLKFEQQAKDKAEQEVRDEAAQEAKDKAAREQQVREQQERKQKEQEKVVHEDAGGLIRPDHVTRAHVTIVRAKSIEALRSVNAVRALQPLEDDQIVSNLPGGVYGFTVPWIINTDSSGIVGGTGVDKLGLSRLSRGTFVMEIHKLDSGDVFVAGYLSESDLARLQSPSRTTDAKATLFFSPYHEFSVAVAIPLSRIKASRNRRVENYYANDISVGVLDVPSLK